MILAKDLIVLLKKYPPNAEIMVYEGERSGLHVSVDDEPCGWIEVGETETLVSVDDTNHQVLRS
jgi:hypothetical protein